MKFYIHENVKNAKETCRMGYIVLNNVKVQGTQPVLAQKYSKLSAAVAKAYDIKELLQGQRIVGMSGVYSASISHEEIIYEPESAALVRRILCNKAYYVNSVITTVNYCALKFLTPISAYDLEQVNGDIAYRQPCEDMYVNLSGESVKAVEEAFLTDDRGVFGSVEAQAGRTAVTLSTNRVLVVLYNSTKIKQEYFAKILDYTADMLICYNGGTVEEMKIIEQ